MTIGAGFASLHGLAERYVALARDAISDGSSLTDRGKVNEYIAVYRAGVGRNWAESEALLTEACSMFERIGDRRRWIENLSLLSIVLFLKGDLSQAREIRERIYMAAVRQDDTQMQGIGLIEQAEIALRTGRLDDAAAFLDQAVALGEKVGRIEQIWLYGLFGAIRLRLGQPELARAAAAKAQELISVTRPTAFYLLDGLSGIAEVELALWQAASSADHARQCKVARRSLRLLTQFSRAFPVGLPRTQLWTGVYAWVAGRPSRAHTAWQRGLREAERLRMPYDQGLLHYYIGRHLAPTDPARGSHLRDARYLFREVGAGADLVRTQAELD